MYKQSSLSPDTDNAMRRTRFEAVFVTIRNELTGHLAGEGMPHDVLSWFSRNLDYNVPGGKLNRGMSVVDTVEILKGRALTEDEYFHAALLGWCVELLQAYFLVVDDIMDSSITRRSQPCWYLAPLPSLTPAPSSPPVSPSDARGTIGMIAINDAFMLNSAIYHLLKSHFRGEPYYVDLLELFHETTYKTEMGQLVDLIMAPEGEVDLSRFSLTKHHLIVTYKTAYYSFYLPVALAMHMCNIPTVYTVSPPLPAQTQSQTASVTTVHPYSHALSILLPLGQYFQIQDDFLDFYGTPAQIGKVGTDIVDNKCSWCINTCLTHCTPAQRTVLDMNYGRGEAGGEEERLVKAMYQEVGLQGIYEEYERAVYEQLNELIEAIPEGEVLETAAGEHVGLQKEIFKVFLEKIYKRSK